MRQAADCAGGPRLPELAAMNGLSIPLIFGAGVLSFLSPCVLPLVPPYLTYMSGSSFEQLRADGATAGVVWRRSVFTSVFFIDTP